MGTGINTNLVSLNAQRMLSLSQNGLATSMQRLSSGLRVNSAKDDAAGLAIAERMNSQIRGMNQAARNANDGISLLQTAEGASSKVTDMLQRMRELAVQSANGTNSDDDRKALQAEVLQLKAEIERVGTTTKFNGMTVFDQSRELSVSSDPRAVDLMEKLKGGWLAKAEALVKEAYGLEARNNLELKVDLTGFSDGRYNTAARVLSNPPVNSGTSSKLVLQIDLADYAGMDEIDFLQTLAHEMVHAVQATGESWGKLRVPAVAPGDQENQWFIEGLAEFVYGADQRLQQVGLADAKADDLATWSGSQQDYAGGYLAVKYLDYWVAQKATGKGVKDVMEYLHNNADKTLDDAIVAIAGPGNNLAAFKIDYAAQSVTSSTSAWYNLTNSDTGGILGSDKTATTRAGADSIAVTATNTDVQKFNVVWGELGKDDPGPGRVWAFQVGASAGDFVYAGTGSMNLGSMGLEELDVSTTDGANAAMSQLDSAIAYVSSQRGKLGAMMNRFENVISVLNVSSENASAARGRIVDADFAVETANLSRSQILQQAGTAMVAQANQLPQNVLSLLR